MEIEVIIETLSSNNRELRQSALEAAQEVPSSEWTYPFIKTFAETLMLTDDYRGALFVLEEKIEDYKEKNYYTWLGYLYWRCGLFAKAIEFLSNAKELTSEYLEVDLTEMEEDIDFYIDISKFQIEREKKIREMRSQKQRPKKRLSELDLNEFWNNNEYYTKNYTEPYPTDTDICKVEKELGYKLPQSYIDLMKNRNGGAPRNTCFPSPLRTTWAADHIAIESIKGIGFKQWSLCGELGSKDAISAWYHDIGIGICDCPSGGHDMIFLDYRKNGIEGEPEVVHVDQGNGEFVITLLAHNFEEFICGLYSEDE